MKYSVQTSLRHKGKVLQVDVEREMVTLLGGNGDVIGSLSWDVVIDQVLAHRKVVVQKEVRAEPRISLIFKVRYTTPEGQQFESRAGGIGGGGLFIESHSPLPIGTKLAMEFSLPQTPDQWLSAKGTIAWVCPKADQYKARAEAEVASKGAALLQTMNSVRSYTSEHIDPLLHDSAGMQNEFIPETVPAFADQVLALRRELERPLAVETITVAM